MYTHHLQNLMPFPSILYSTYLYLQFKKYCIHQSNWVESVNQCRGHAMLHEKEEKKKKKRRIDERKKKNRRERERERERGSV